MEIPRTAEDITAEWLTEALRQSGYLGEGRVASVRLDPTGVGQGLAAAVERATVTYSGAAGSAPETLIAKIPSQHARTRELFTEFGLYEREARFYLELAEEVGIPIPKLYYGDFDAVTGSFVLLLEDLGTANADDPVIDCSIDDARTVVQNSAVMHARWWNSDRLGQLPWLRQQADPASAQRSRQHTCDRGAVSPTISGRYSRLNSTRSPNVSAPSMSKSSPARRLTPSL